MTREDSPTTPPLNPYQPSAPGASSNPAGSGTSAGRAAYNIVSDTVVGVNVRGRDNLFQAIVTLAAALLGAAIGSGLTRYYQEWNVPVLGGGLAGLLAGLVVGVFGSGIFLMVYRAVRHLQGKHD